MTVTVDELAAEANSAPNLRSIGDVAADVVADLRFRAVVRRLHDRGPRFLCEFLAHIAADRLLRVYIEQLAERFLTLDDSVLEMLGADLMPPAPVMLAVDNESEAAEIGDDYGSAA